MAATSTLSGTASSSTWGSQLNDYLDAHESISTQMDAHLRQLPPPPILAEEKQMRLGEEKLYTNGASAVDNKYARLDEEGREFLRRLREYRSGYGGSSVLLGGAGKGVATGDAYHCPEVECAGAGRGPQASGAGDAAKMEKSKPCRAPPSSTQLLLPAHRSATTPQFTTRTPSSSSSSRPRLREEERDLSSAGMTASPSRSPSSFREELAHVLQEYRSGLESTAVRMPLRGLPPEDGLLQKDSTIESRSSRLQVLLDQKVLNRPKGSIFPAQSDKRKSDRRSRSRSRSRSNSANGARSTSRASSVVAGAGGGRRGVEVGAVSMLELDAKLSTNRSTTSRAAAASNSLHSTSVSIIRPRTGSSGSTSTPSFSRTKTPPTAGRGPPPPSTSLRSSGAAASSRSHFRSINLRQGSGAGERGSGFAAPQPQEEDINQHEEHHLHSGSTFLRESRDVFYDDPYCNPNNAADHWMNPPPTTAAQHLMPPPGASMQTHNSDIFGESALFYDDVLCNIRAPPVPHDEDQGERFATAEVEVDNDEKSSSDLGDVSMSSSHDSDCSVASSTSSSSSRASGEIGTSEDGSDASPVASRSETRSSSSRRRTEDASSSRRSRGLMRNGKSSSRAKPSRSKEKATTGVKSGCFPSSPHRKRKVKAAKSDQQKSIKSSNSRSSSKGSASHSVTFPSKGESKVIRFSGASPTPQHGAGEESTTAEVDSAPGSRSASVSIHAGATVAGGSHQQQERGRAFISHNKMRHLSHDATSYLQKRSSKNKSPHPRRRFLEPQTLSGGARLPAAPPPTTTEEQIPTKCAQETRGPSTTIAGAKVLGTRICATGTDQQSGHQFNELQEGGVPALHPPSLNTSVCCEQSFLASTSAVSTPMRTAVNASTRRVSVSGVLSSSTITQALAEEAVQPVSAYRKRSTSSPNVGLAGIAAGSSQLPEPSGCSMRVGDLAKTPVRKSSAAQQTQRQPAAMPAFSIAPRIEAEGPRSREQTRLSNEGADEKAQLSELELLKKIALASEDDTHAGSSPQLQHLSSAWKPWSASQHRSPQPLSLCGPPAWDLSTDPVTGAITVRGPPGEAGEMKLTADERGLYDSDTSGEPCANVFQKLHKKDTPKALGVASRGVSSDLGRGGGAPPTPPADSCPAEQDNSTLNYSTTSSILNNSVLNVPQSGSSSLNVLPNNSLHLIDTSFDEVSFSRIFSQAMASAQEKHGVDFRKPSLLMGTGSTSVGAAADGPCGGGGPPPESSTSLPAIPECATPPASEDNAAAFTMPPAPAAAADFFTLPPGGKQPRASAPRSPPGGGRATKGILKQSTGASTERNTDATEATPDRRPVPVVAARARPKKETGKINFLENAEKYVADLFDSDVFKQRRAAAMGHKRTPGVEDVDLDEQALVEKENDECSCSGPTETQRTATEGLLLLGGTGNGRSPSCFSPPLLPCKLEDVITSGPGLSDYDRILEDIRFQARQSGTAPECGPQEREATSSLPGARAEPSTDSRREEAEQRWSVEAAIANGGSMMEIDKSAARVACDVLHERNQSLLRDILGELEEPDRHEQDELMAQCVHGVQAKAGGGGSAAPAEAATSRRAPLFVGAQERAAEQRTQRLPASQLTIYAFGDAKTTTVGDLSVCDADGEDPRDDEKKASSLDEMVDEAIERKSSTCRSTLAEIEAYCDQMKKKTANIVEEDSFRSQLLKCIGMARDLKLHGLH